ncbi:rCG24306, isoform CRA_a [Rattus norvegicus]|uniref:RCG24306, isoform CRA_a n=1 Tax=Rattus norvegicus TaxID=10116 RepID=A6KAK7_RAT|nr:rCG24306, isoform CRA_a [Rattus norvegicus]
MDSYHGIPSPSNTTSSVWCLWAAHPETEMSSGPVQGVSGH